MMPLSLLATLALSAPFPSHAGGGSTGGGNAVVCFESAADLRQVRLNGNIVSNSQLERISEIQTYDLFEATRPRGVSPKAAAVIPISDRESLMDYAGRMLQRLDDGVHELTRETGALSFEHFEARMLRQGFKESILGKITENAIINQTEGVIHVDDYDPTGQIDQERCAMVTVAAQRIVGSVRTTGGTRLEIHLDSRLFHHPKHSRLSQAVLLLHEVTYAWGRERGHVNSAPTRRLIAQLLRPELTDQELARTLQEEGFFRTAEPWIRTETTFETTPFAWYRTLKTGVDDSTWRPYEEFDRKYPKYARWANSQAARILGRAGAAECALYHPRTTTEHVYSCVQHAQEGEDSARFLAELDRTYMPHAREFIRRKLQGRLQAIFDSKIKPEIFKAHPAESAGIIQRLQNAIQNGTHEKRRFGNGYLDAFVPQFSQEDAAWFENAELTIPVRPPFDRNP